MCESDEVKLLVTAQEVLTGYGWVQGQHPEHEGLCALGAVNKAAELLWGGDDWHHDDRHGETFHNALNALHKLVRKARYLSIIDYNDDPGTGERNVLDIFGRAAEQFSEDTEIRRDEDD